jgi:hypothetical protein
MSPRTVVRLIGVRGFARLALGQARPQRPAASIPAQLTSMPGGQER